VVGGGIDDEKERAGGGWRHGCGLQALVGCLLCDACVVLGCPAQQRDVSIAHSLLASEGSESSATVNGHGHGQGCRYFFVLPPSFRPSSIRAPCSGTAEISLPHPFLSTGLTPDEEAWCA